MIGGAAFLRNHDTFGEQTVLNAFGRFMYGYSLIGWTLVLCGAVSLMGVCHRKLGKVAALFFAAVLFGVGLFLQTATDAGQADVDSWLLFLCAFTCVMRWGLYELEPELGRP